MKQKFSKQEKSWIMGDWANSAHSAIVSAIVLPLVFKASARGAGLANELADSYWAFVTSGSLLVMALLAPLLGTLGDFRGFKMRLFTAFTILGAVSTALLGVTQNYVIILVFYALANFGFYGSIVYYDGSLLDVTTPDRTDRVSSMGFSMGYIGGSTIPLLMAIALLQLYERVGMSYGTAIFTIFFITGAWWLVFSIPMIKNVKQIHFVEPEARVIKQSFSRLAVTFKNVRNDKNLWLYLLSYFFYIDGVGTIIHMAVVYGDTLGFGQMELILALLATQLIAVPCAILYGRMAEKIGARKMIMVGIATYLVICVLGYFTNTYPVYLLLAGLVGTAQGGIQALSKSYYCKLIPDMNQMNEYFGFFDIFGKFASILGPMLFGMSSMLFGHSRYGVLSIALLFIIGGMLFAFSTKQPQPEAQRGKA